MSNALYFDCFSGISGDMLLGSLLDLGLSLEALSSELSKLKVKNFTLSAKKVLKSGIAATKFDVQIGHEHVPRNFFDIERIIQVSDLSQTVREKAIGIFKRLAEAEAKVHGSTLQEIHFHEVGAVDAIVDIVGACIALELMGVRTILASPLNVGSGFVESAHGTLPVPAPATAELLKGIPIYSNQVCGELVTPTGAAIISAFSQGFGTLPKLKIGKIGYGAGTKEIKGFPNVVRVLQGELLEEEDLTETAGTDSRVVVIETNIDDMNPQIYGYLQEKLLALGALDVFAYPVQMKKNRLGILLTVVTSCDQFEAVSGLIFGETTTIGIRYHETKRRVLKRETEFLESEYGKVGVKVSRMNGKIVNFSPEFEDCCQAAEKHHVPYKWVQSSIVQQFMNLHGKEILLERSISSS